MVSADLWSLGRQPASDTLAHLAAAAGTVRQARGYLPSRRVYVTALWSVVIAPTNGGVARLSGPGWLVTH